MKYIDIEALSFYQIEFKNIQPPNKYERPNKINLT